MTTTASTSFTDVLGQQVEMIWHKETMVSGLDAIVIPGGFSYGDYLRTGAIARFSPVMGAVKEFAEKRRAGHGHLQRISDSPRGRTAARGDAAEPSLHFVCKDVSCEGRKCCHSLSLVACESGQVLKIPIAHADGNYYTDPVTLGGDCRPMLRWSSAIAPRRGRSRRKRIRTAPSTTLPAFINAEGNVLGMMPHPERCAEEVLGNDDGRLIFLSMLESLKRRPLKMVGA